MIRRGFVHWVMLDKRRPALVISPDFRNLRSSEIIVVPASSLLRFGPTHIVLKKGEGGIRHPSVLHAENITTLRKAEIDETPLGAALAPARLAEVERAVMRAIGIVID